MDEEGLRVQSLWPELMPEIEPLDYSVLKLKKLVAEANEKDIDDALSKLAEQQRIRANQFKEGIKNWRYSSN